MTPPTPERPERLMQIPELMLLQLVTEAASASGYLKVHHEAAGDRLSRAVSDITKWVASGKATRRVKGAARVATLRARRNAEGLCAYCAKEPRLPGRRLGALCSVKNKNHDWKDR